MDTTFEKELILKGLYRDRDELAAKLSDLDKLIKKIKTNNFSLNSPDIITSEQTEATTQPVTAIAFPLKANFKVQLLSVIDIIGVACKLKEIHEKYKDLTGFNNPIRETVRTLHKHDLLKLLRPKGTERGLYWVRTTWLEDNNTKLMDKHKFQGFELLYTDDKIEFV